MLVLQWGRGFKAAEKSFDSSTLRPAWSLQWGRGFKAAENARFGDDRSVIVLQWGRGFKAAEKASGTSTVGHDTCVVACERKQNLK